MQLEIDTGEAPPIKQSFRRMPYAAREEVAEALLSDRGTNLLSHLMTDVCARLGIAKLNTTAYHPQCDGLVEQFNRTLKAMLRKHVSRFGTQWDQYLSGVLWAYRNTPHDTTGEKPSYLLFGVDCRSPTEAELTPPSTWNPISVTDYREELFFRCLQQDNLQLTLYKMHRESIRLTSIVKQLQRDFDLESGYSSSSPRKNLGSKENFRGHGMVLTGS